LPSLASLKRKDQQLKSVERVAETNHVVNLCVSRILTEAENAVLNKGLGFVESNKKTPLVSALVNFNAFARKLRWSVWWMQKKGDKLSCLPKNRQNPVQEKISQLIRRKKTTAPSINSALEKFISATRKNIRHKLRMLIKSNRSSNITQAEQDAIDHLTNDTSIVIKKADKGGMVTVMDRIQYTAEAHRQLNDDRYYQRLVIDPLKEVIDRLHTVLTIQYGRGQISEALFAYLDPSQNENRRLAAIYFLPKVHKNPPTTGRPIVSLCGTPLERPAEIIDQFLLPIVRNQSTYTKDTADIIKNILRNPLPPSCFLCTWDVTSMYTNISHEEAEVCIKEVLTENWQSIHCLGTINLHALLELVSLVLKENVFEFDGSYFRQKFGVSMGSKCSPEIADIVMFKLETELLSKYGKHIAFWQRYRDDILFAWTDTVENLHQFETEANSIHASLKFEQTRSLESIDFLDLTIFKGKRFAQTGILDTKIYTKPTNRFQYLYRTSSHKESTFKAFLKGELIRARRNCSDDKDLSEYIEKFRSRILVRGYGSEELDAVLADLNEHKWNGSNKKRNKTTHFGLAYKVTCYESAIIEQSLSQHWFMIRENALLTKCLGKKPTVVWSRQKNFSERLVRARLKKSNDTGTR
jgi:hypothetical protein